jgi:hypothetical protein
MKHKARHGPKHDAVRMLKQALHFAVRGAGSSISVTKESERLLQRLERYVRRLEKLAIQDPQEKFWKVLRNALHKLLKYVKS